MKKILLILALSAAAVLSSCSAAKNVETTSSRTTAPTTAPTTQTQASSSTAVVTEIVTTKETSKKATKPTEPTEKATKKKPTKPTRPVPTQGRTKPNTHVVVTFPKGSFTDSDLVFTKGNIKINLGESWKKALKKLGKKGDVTEISSKRTEYDYSNFTVTTLLVDDEELVEKIEITDDTLATPRGIRIGSFASRLRKTYGDPYKKNDTAYRYGNDEKMLYFTYEDNMVDGIYYKIIF